MRSCLQVAIASLSFFAWNTREAACRLPRLTTFLWISATVLRLRVWKSVAQRTHHWLNSRRQLLDRPQHGLAEFTQSSPIQTSVKSFTYTSTRQPKVNVILFVGHGVLNKREPKAGHRRIGGSVPLSYSGGHWQNQKRFELVENHRYPSRSL